MTQSSESTLFVVDDDEQVRTSLELIAQSVQLPVELFDSADAFLDTYSSERPGCLVLDVSMPGMSGLELQKRLVEDGTTIPIIMITAYAEVPMAVEAMENGAFGFVQKPFSRQQLLDKIQSAIAADRERRKEAGKRNAYRSRLAKLAPREREVLALLVSGMTTKRIALELEISPKTVDFHRWNVLEKMEVESVVDLARESARFGSSA